MMEQVLDCCRSKTGEGVCRLTLLKLHSIRQLAVQGACVRKHELYCELDVTWAWPLWVRNRDMSLY